MYTMINRDLIIKDFYLIYGCEQYIAGDHDSDSYHDICIIVNIEPLYLGIHCPINLDSIKYVQLDYHY